jgi:ubiquinone/menaquinone biosynthesis C-methylase UbiE
MSQVKSEFNQEALEELSEQIWGHMGGAMTMALCFLGEQLGLYRALTATGAVTSAGLATHTGLHERWLREWLQQQACAGFVAYEGNGRFYLTPEAIELLANEDSLFFAGGGLTTVMALAVNAPNLKECFQTGLGLPYDALGFDCAVGLEGMGGAWYRQKLVSEVLTMMNGVVEKLERGALVADIGCGVGTATMVMAAAFPQSEFHGYDTSQHALVEARRRTADAGLTNLFWHDPTVEPLPDDGRFDFITTFDAVHDTTNPVGLIAAAYKALKPDGTWFITDIAGKSSFEKNLNEHPLAGMFYAFSVLICMSSGLAEPSGAGLGTVGFHEEMARQMTREAGFTQFRRLDIEDLFNNRYEVRP